MNSDQLKNVAKQAMLRPSTFSWIVIIQELSEKHKAPL